MGFFILVQEARNIMYLHKKIMDFEVQLDNGWTAYVDAELEWQEVQDYSIDYHAIENQSIEIERLFVQRTAAHEAVEISTNHYLCDEIKAKLLEIETLWGA